MGTKPARVAVHRLSLAEQRVLSSFISGRLPAGQVHGELQQARTTGAPVLGPQPQTAPAPQPVPAVAA
jgi:hypothetical protein